LTHPEKEETRYQLSEREAFQVMSLFLNRWAASGGNELLPLLGDITVLPNWGTSDPATWDDWLDCVRR
jgi:hypothetical protein